MVLLISYDLIGHERPAAYRAVKERIEDSAIDSRRALYSQWMVETDCPARWWFERLKPVIDKNDKLFISQVTAENTGRLTKEIWEWLEARV